MKCVVIGGSGFLGGAIVDYLLTKGDSVVSVDRSPHVSRDPRVEKRTVDIREKNAVKSAVAGADEVYNTAGMLGTTELNGEIRKAIEVNVVGAVNVMEACIEEGVEKLFYPTKPNGWLNTYSITKQASEDFGRLLGAKYPLSVTQLRWFNAYGPGQHTHPIRKIGPTFCLMARFGIPIEIFGSGANIVDMVYSKDVAKWSVEATRAGVSDAVYDLGTGLPRSVVDVAKDVQKVSGKAGLCIKRLPMREGEIEGARWVADENSLKARLRSHDIELQFTDWLPTLEETYQYYCNIPEDEALQALRAVGVAVG